MLVENQAGCVENFFSESQIAMFRKIFASETLKDTYSGEGETQTIGVHENNIVYPIFEKEFMEPVRKYFQQDLKVVFSMFADCKNPFDIHDDCGEHIRLGLPGKPWISCLIPLSVDNDVNKTHMASTVIFNEKDYRVQKDPNCDHLFEEKFSHVERSKLSCLTMKAEYQWKRADMIWWYSPLCHTSTHFKNFSSKQMLVCHTYIV